MDIDGSVALITGASRGIGASVARSLAKKRATLLLVARSASDLESVAAECREAGSPNVHCIEADVATYEGLDKIVMSAVQLTDGFDVLVNNAGIGDIKPMTAVSDDEYDRTMAINLRAPFMLTQAAIKNMRRRGGGQIVQIASGLAYRGMADWSLYAATKFGLRGFTECVRFEVAHQGIKVGIVAPGYTETHFFDKIPDKGDPRTFAGALHPDDVAHAVIAMIEQGPNSDIREITVRPATSP